MSEVVLGRRSFLSGLVALAASPKVAKAQTTDASRIPAVYQAITTQAFNVTYGDTLSPANISGLDDLNMALAGTADTYRENLILAAEEYVSALGPDDQQRVLSGLNWKPFTLGRADDNLISAFIRDEGEYLNAGRTYEINPLFAAIHTLGQEEKITVEQANSYIVGAREMAYPADSVNRDFHTALVERVEAVINGTPRAAPVAPAPLPANPFE